MALSLDDRLRNFRANRPAPETPALKIADLLGGGEIVGEAGVCYRIARRYPGSFELPARPPEQIRRNLRMLRGVGPKTEERLHACGLDSLEKLAGQDRWCEQAQELLAAIEARDIGHLQRRGAHDRDLLTFFSPEDLVCLDIETTGLYSVLPLFLVGLLYSDGGELHLVQFLARRYEEERALLAAVAGELPRFRALVSYNGRAFDLPYLTGRYLAHRLSCRLDQPHIDLLRHARRKYRGRLPDCRLTTIEQEVLAERRTDDVPGYLIPELYHQFVKTQDQSIIKGIVEHNAQDLLALARLIHLVE